MRTRRHSCRRHWYLQYFLGPLWMADLMDIFGDNRPDDLQQRLEPGQLAKENPDAPECSHLYQKYSRGEVLPSDQRIETWKAICCQADRVPRLSLWYALDSEADLTLDEYQSLFNHLAPAVGKLVWKRAPQAAEFPWSADTVLPRHTLLRPLVRTCNVDALTVLLQWMNDGLRYVRGGYVPEAAICSVAHHAQDAFARLSVFPPFNSIQVRLFNYLVQNFLTIEVGSRQVFAPMPEEQMLDLTNDAVQSLTLMGRVGLVGPELAEQIKAVNWYFEKASPVSKAQLRERCLAATSAPVVIDPQNPVWRALKKLRHPGTRANQPIYLPWKGRLVDGFRIANALGPAELNRSPLNK